MSDDGLVGLKRWYEPGADRDDYADLSEFEVYWDSVHKQYTAKCACSRCWDTLGWYCYDCGNGATMVRELLEGMLCVPCFENENIDFDEDECELMVGVKCEY